MNNTKQNKTKHKNNFFGGLAPQAHILLLRPLAWPLYKLEVGGLAPQAHISLFGYGWRHNLNDLNWRFSPPSPDGAKLQRRQAQLAWIGIINFIDGHTAHHAAFHPFHAYPA